MSKIAASVIQGKRLTALMGQSLFTNAGYLLGVNLVNALTGFAFWGLAARLCGSEHVGTASAVISAVGIVSGVAGLGTSVGLVRFLPESHAPSCLLNSTSVFNIVTAILSSVVFLAGLPLWSPSLIALRQNAFYAIGFVVYTVVTSLGVVFQAVPIARRQSLYALIHTGIANGCRLVVIAPLAGLGALGIVGATLSALGLTLAADLIVILPKVEQQYWPRFEFGWGTLRAIIPYSIGNYIEVLLTQTPQMVLPLIALEILGSASSGYVYIAWMLGTLLISPGMALAISAFAEGSNLPHRLDATLRQAVKLSLLLTAPAAGVVGVAAPWILSFFGAHYAQEAAGLLRWLAVAAPVAILARMYSTRLRVQKRIGGLIVTNGVVAVATIGASLALMSHSGVAAVGIGWLAGNGLVAAAAAVDVWNERRKIQG